MTKNRILLIVAFTVYAILALASCFDGGDFDIYLEAAEKIKSGRNIYMPPFVKLFGYSYSPLFALILAPFTFSYFWTEILWSALSGYWLYAIWRMISAYFPQGILNDETTMWWVILSLFFMIRFIIYNVSMVQVTIFMLWAMLLVVRLANTEKNGLAGLLLALIVNIKIIPIVLVPYLIWRGKGKVIFFFFAGYIVFLLLPAIFIGWDRNLFLLSQWWYIIDPSNQKFVIETIVTLQSVSAIFTTYFTSTESNDFNFLDFSQVQLAWVSNMFKLALIALTLYFLGKPKSSKELDMTEFRAIAYILFLMPLILPHQQKYAFLFQWPMIAYLIFYYLSIWKTEGLKKVKIELTLFIGLLVIYTPLIGSDIIGRALYDQLQALKILGINAVLMVPLIILANPSNLEGKTITNE